MITILRQKNQKAASNVFRLNDCVPSIGRQPYDRGWCIGAHRRSTCFASFFNPFPLAVSPPPPLCKRGKQVRVNREENQLSLIKGAFLLNVL